MTSPKAPYFDNYDYFLLLQKYNKFLHDSGINILATKKATSTKKIAPNTIKLEDKLLQQMDHNAKDYRKRINNIYNTRPPMSDRLIDWIGTRSNPTNITANFRRIEVGI